MTVSAPPGDLRYVRSASSRGRYLVFAEWSSLPLGTVRKVGRERWEAFPRLGRPVGQRKTRKQTAAMLAAWTWSRMSTPAKRDAIAHMWPERLCQQQEVSHG
jgi:hypothetical protein